MQESNRNTDRHEDKGQQPEKMPDRRRAPPADPAEQQGQQKTGRRRHDAERDQAQGGM
jgi:hypothetical protein